LFCYVAHITYLDNRIGTYHSLFHFSAIIYIFIASLLLAAFYTTSPSPPTEGGGRHSALSVFAYNRGESKNRLLSKGYVKGYKNALMGIDAPQFTQKKRYSKDHSTPLLPQWVTGFADGEGCFLINIRPAGAQRPTVVTSPEGRCRPKPKMKTGYSIELVFKIALHLKDRALLEKNSNIFWSRNYYCEK
jgi:LAGLIDADG endonuclease